MASAGLRGAWGWYQKQLASRPVQVQTFTSMLLWGTGDAIAQNIEIAGRKQKGFQRFSGESPGNDGMEAEKSPSVSSDDEAHILMSNASWSAEEKESVRRPSPPSFAASGGAAPANVAVALPGGETSLDMQRVVTTSLFGLCFVGPVGHFWYILLDRIITKQLRLKPRTRSFILTKVAMDTFIFGPFHILGYYTWAGLAKGLSLPEVWSNCCRDFWPVLISEAGIWPVVQSLNFFYVPVPNQLLVVNLVCLVDSAWLSWLRNQEDAPWKQWLDQMIEKLGNKVSLKKRLQ
eukprot:TRINITY_DN9690_c0_g1_i1.p1 TRINITY_DN9690_c0_g1~~TRINITY_DN9690_c0_g1_i1.p1  ORF type:complete len:290 (+),score=40.89 TRINITY_DN9690_c0_g1_i1:262-1131(+)